MATINPTPNMSLPVPDLTDPGPDYANNVNTSLDIIDGHTHTGAPTDGLQLDLSRQKNTGDIQLNDNNLGTTRSVEFQNQPGELVGSQDVNCIYVQNNILGFNNSVGLFIPLTGTLSAQFTNFTNLTITANHTVLPTDTFNLISCNGSGPITVTLPTAGAITPVAAWRLYIIKDISGNAASNHITIQVAGGSGNTFIPGSATSITLSSNGGYYALFTDGISGWYFWSQDTYNSGDVLNILSGATVQVAGTISMQGGALLADVSSQITLGGTGLQGTVAIGQVDPLTITGPNGIFLETGILVVGSGAVISGKAAGIKSVIAGGISGNTASGIQSDAVGAITLTGGSTDWVTFSPARTKTIVFPLIPLGGGFRSISPLTNDNYQQALDGPIVNGWILAGNGAWQVVTSTGVGYLEGGLVVAQNFAVPVMHEGATITSIGVSFIVIQAHTGVPSAQPTIKFYKVAYATGKNTGNIFTLIGSFQLAASNFIVYNNDGLSQFLTITGLSEVVDNANYSYYIGINDETGTNSLPDNIYYNMSITYSNITVHNFVT